MQINRERYEAPVSLRVSAEGRGQILPGPIGTRETSEDALSLLPEGLNQAQDRLV